jgi:aspartate/glutamate racemase
VILGCTEIGLLIGQADTANVYSVGEQLVF